MSRRKLSQVSTETVEFQTSWTKVCREEDVLIVPLLRKTSELPPTEEESLAPIVWVVCERESPVAIVCKGFYVEYALVRAIFSWLTNFPTIVTLKIENCCIGREIVYILATLLADSPGRNIVNLSLDGNGDIANELPSLLRTELKYLSLRRCNLDDAGVALLSQELSEKSSLLVLNLNMNRIGDEGVLALANALRTNRTLLSLSLSGNQITDIGASHLAEVLGRFPLTQEEITCRRRRVFDRLLLVRSMLQKLTEEWKQRNESDRSLSKRNKSSESGPKKPPTSSRDRKRSSSARGSSRETSRVKKKLSRSEGSNPEPSPSEMGELKQQAENEIPIDGHPFVTEVIVSDDLFWCNGCWSLGNLNLSYNHITEEFIPKFVSAIYHQDKIRKSRPGLLRLIIQPGNPIPLNSCKLEELECVLKNRSRNVEDPINKSERVPSPKKR